MAASGLQPAGSALLLTHSVLNSDRLPPRQLVSGNIHVLAETSFPAIPGVLEQCEASWEGNSLSGALDSPGSRQELLWRHFFLHPALWWDNRHDKKGSRSPDFRHRVSKEVLWLNSFWKPAWVDEQLAALDTQLGFPPSTSRSTLPNDFGPRRVSGYRRDGAGEHVRKLCENGRLRDAVEALEVLVQAESWVSRALFYVVLKSCIAQKNLALGRRVHKLAVTVGYESTAFVGNHILRMYASHGRLQEAQDVFLGVANPDAFSWSAVIAAHSNHGEPKQAIKLYQKMRCSSVKPDGHVFVAALQACSRAADLESGRQVHCDVMECRVEPDLFVWTCLVDMYAKCGRLEDARTIFDSLVTKNVVTWNTMIAGYAQHEQGQEALSLYKQMEVEGVVLADPVTFACLLKACAALGALQQGKELHSQILKRGLALDIFVGSSLVDMYAKCGRLEEARSVFDTLAVRDVVTWNAMIGGYVAQGLGQEALALYVGMEQEGTVVANSFIFACLLKACATVAALQQGKQLHAQILQSGMEVDLVLGNSLVDMYAKCGRLTDARKVFDSLPTKDVVTWTIMINGFGQSSQGHNAIECFQEMMRQGVQASEATFTCLLVACSHDGLVKEGQQFFKAMVEECGIMPTTEHCTCMVDLLGRAGYLEEAEEMLLSFKSNDVGLMSLLTACRSHGDIERGRRCFESLMELHPENAAGYVLMGKMYADASRWSDVERIERLRKSAGARKKPAIAGIEVNRHVHNFFVGEDEGDISARVRSMSIRLKEEGGHVPRTDLVLKRLSEKQKEDELCGHAEKLALAYGLMNTPVGTPLLVTKNMRMCGDCHSSTETMSRIEKREIIVRDAHRVHRFVDGCCHCGGRP